MVTNILGHNLKITGPISQLEVGNMMILRNSCLHKIKKDSKMHGLGLDQYFVKNREYNMFIILTHQDKKKVYYKKLILFLL